MKKIKPFLFETFNIKPEESQKFSLLFFHSFFLGLFIAFYFVPANSVFIHHFGSEQLPLAYIISGIAGYLTAYLYSVIQKKIHSKGLFLGALVFMLFVAIAGRIGLYFYSEKWLSLFVFIWAWPFISLVGIESGGLSLRLLNLIQVKRLFGLINTGGVIASILGYLTIPVLMKFLGHSYDLLYIGGLGLIVSIVLLFIIYKRFPEKEMREVNKQKSASTTSFFTLLKEKYFILIFLSAVLSMTAIYVVDFGFLASIKAQPRLFSNPETVSRFMALVFGGLKIGEFVLSSFSSRILSKYGVKLGLTILPLFSTLFILLATLTGLLFGASSIIFLIIMVLNKSFERILRRALDDPSFNILYQPLPDHLKLSVQTRVGVVMQVAIGIAGVLLFLVNKILITEDGFNLKYFPLFFLPVMLVWLWVARNLYLSYKDRLRIVLTEIGIRKKREISEYSYGSELLVEKLHHPEIELNEMGVIILSETDPKLMEVWVEELLKKDNTIIQKLVLFKIDPTWKQDLIPAITKIYQEKENYPKEILQGAIRAFNNLDFSTNPLLGNEDMLGMVNTDSLDNKMRVVRYLMENNTSENESLILKLIEDTDPFVKYVGISIAGKNDSPGMLNKLIAMFQLPEYYHQISSILVEKGNDALPGLEVYFTRNIPVNIILKIIEIYAKINTPKSNSFLVKHLTYHDNEVQLAVIRALKYCQYQANASEVTAIKQKLREIVENIVWIYACILDIQAEKNTLRLIQALDLEKENKYEILFNLLSFIYQPATIDLIKKNVIGEDTIYALEIIDNFISQDVKQLIIPLFDKISISQRIKRLHTVFPQKKMVFTDRLKDILVKDYNKVDLWTKTKAIELLGKIHKKKQSEEQTSENGDDSQDVELWTEETALNQLNNIRRSDIPDEIFLCLHHTDELIYSTAAKLIYDENPSRCFNYLRRLSSEKQELISMLKNGEGDAKKLLTDRVKYLKRIPLFFTIPENSLVKLAKIVNTIHLNKGDSISFIAEDGSDNVFLLLKGVLMHDDLVSPATFSKNEIIIRGIHLADNAYDLVCRKNAIVIVVNRLEYFNLIADDTAIIQHLFDRLNKLK